MTDPLSGPLAERIAFFGAWLGGLARDAEASPERAAYFSPEALRDFSAVLADWAEEALSLEITPGGRPPGPEPVTPPAGAEIIVFPTRGIR
jgi:hypothetical protein